MKITVDFDKTLTRPDVQDFIRALMVWGGVEVHVLTYRYDSAHYYKYGSLYPDTVNNHDLWDIVESVGLERNVIFTNCRPKSEYLNSVGNVLLHLDDDVRVMEDLKHNSNVIPIQVGSPSYQKKIIRILKEYHEKKRHNSKRR